MSSHPRTRCFLDPGSLVETRYDEHMLATDERMNRLTGDAIRRSRPVLIIASVWSEQRFGWVSLVVVDGVLGWAYTSTLDKMK